MRPELAPHAKADCASAAHDHCHLDEAVVRIEFGPYGVYLVPIDGMRCPECNRVTCNGCITTHTPTGEPACRKCADDLCDRAQEADEFSLRLTHAIREVTSFTLELANCTNDIELLEQRKELEHLEEAVAIARRAFETRLKGAA